MLDVILPQIIKWKSFKQLIKNSSLVSLQTQQDLSGKFLFEVVQVLYLLFTNWVQGLYQEIQAQGFSYSPSLGGLFGKARACISWYGTSTQLVNSLLHDPF